MSYTASFIKMAIKWTPKPLVLLVANRVLKDIATLTDFSLDLDARKAFFRTELAGETEAIEVTVEGFGVVNEQGVYKFVLQQGLSNRPWLNSLLSRVTGKLWTIPPIPQLAPYMGLIAELLKVEITYR
ncbi:MAG: hypothetical protein EPN21_13860 [Methylococcaceae bacterium]|nr:MAG: hypothetical protein EPN21_13860 [Methylococcaceae bacterium]